MYASKEEAEAAFKVVREFFANLVEAKDNYVETSPRKDERNFLRITDCPYMDIVDNGDFIADGAIYLSGWVYSKVNSMDVLGTRSLPLSNLYPAIPEG